MHDRWTFLTNHAHVLLAVARDPDIRVHDIAGAAGITDRAALLILQDLEDAGYVRRERVGRRNHYTLEPGRPFRHPAHATHGVDELLAIFAVPTDATVAAESAAGPRARQPGDSRAPGPENRVLAQGPGRATGQLPSTHGPGHDASAL